MKTWKIMGIILITALVSLGAGYLIFDRNDQDMSDHQTNQVSSEAEDQVWTCSMHPQIRQNEPGDCPICGMDLIPVSEMSDSDNPYVLEMTTQAVKLANIQTTLVGSSNGETSKEILLTGKVQTDERLVSSQVAHVPGRIEKLFVTYTGEQIKKGQKLATLYSPEIVSAQRELLEALKWKDSQPKLLEAARNKLRYWKISDEMISSWEESNQIQPIITIYADQSGVVRNRRISVGDYLKEGSVLFDIARLDRVWLLFDAYEEDLAAIKLGDVVHYTLTAIPDRTFQVRISFIDPVIHPKTRIASLRAVVSNPQGTLKPEMFVKGVVHTKKNTGTQTVSIPKSAVMWTGTRSVVYVKVPDAMVPSFEFREVRVAEGAGNAYLITEGIQPGERVVTNGAFVIDAAAQLNNMASMMNRNVMVKGVDHNQHLPDYTEVTPPEFKQQLLEVLNTYLMLKDALVATDGTQAMKKAKLIAKALAKVDMTLVEGAAHTYWMGLAIALESHTEKIKEEPDVEKQREQF